MKFIKPTAISLVTILAFLFTSSGNTSGNTSKKTHKDSIASDLTFYVKILFCGKIVSDTEFIYESSFGKFQ